MPSPPFASASAASSRPPSPFAAAALAVAPPPGAAAAGSFCPPPSASTSATAAATLSSHPTPSAAAAAPPSLCEHRHVPSLRFARGRGRRRGGGRWRSGRISNRGGGGEKSHPCVDDVAHDLDMEGGGSHKSTKNYQNKVTSKTLTENLTLKAHFLAHFCWGARARSPEPRRAHHLGGGGAL
jgi:hypothetical protein